MKYEKNKWNGMQVNPCSFSDWSIWAEEGDCHGSFLGRFREIERQRKEAGDSKLTPDLILSQIEDEIKHLREGFKTEDGYISNFSLGEIYELLIHLGDYMHRPLEESIQMNWNRLKFWYVTNEQVIKLEDNTK